MKRFNLFAIIVLLGLLATTQASAQYYYQHMVSAALGAEQFALLKENKVTKIVATSFNGQTIKDTAFKLEQRIHGNQLVLHSKSDFAGESFLTSTYDDKGRIVRVVDSSNSFSNISTYQYNEKGLLTRLDVISSDTVQQYAITESFVITFNENRNPVKMLRIKNKIDTTTIVYIPSENGRPGEEQWWKRGRKIDTWYYYYNDEGYLTDVAKFNPKARKVLPILIFNYDEDGYMVSKTSIPFGSNNYRVWKYYYLENGLKSGEEAFDKHGEMEGRILYQYQ